jgi:hypothetical protein
MRISPGGGFATREVYSDTDEVLIDAQELIILTRQDLIDHSIIINLAPIEEEDRKPAAVFWRCSRLAGPRFWASCWVG